MLLALFSVYMTGNDLKKGQNNFFAKPGQKNKQGK
jgi:hypothetical protein